MHGGEAGVFAIAHAEDQRTYRAAVLAQIEKLLAQTGSDKSKILTATIWMADMADFAEMNAVWDKWVDGKDAPARATGEAKLATPDYKVEIIIVAAR